MDMALICNLIVGKSHSVQNRDCLLRIQLTDMDLFTLLKRTDSYISNWETVIAASLINNGKRMLADQQNSQMQQTAQAPPYAA